MPSYLLEIIVLVGGLVLLLLEAFTSPKRKSSIAIGAIPILCFSLILLFFADKCFGDENVELTRFYAFDPLARFFKLFTIIATILALLLALDHRKVLSKFTANPGSEDGTGEYYWGPRVSPRRQAPRADLCSRTLDRGSAYGETCI